MNELLPILASMSVGGVIGYSTNWIAIKMLFRPLHEVKVLGFKLPFTPGVIPKQRKALGTSIGNTVENYLLTHDSVSETINSASFQSSIKDIIESNLIKQTKSAKTLRQLFSKNNINKNTISTSLHNVTLNNRRAFVKAISKFCDLFVKNISLITLEQLLSSKYHIDFNCLKEKIEKFISRFIQNINNDFDDELTINHLLDNSTKKSVENIIENNLPTIMKKLAKLCEKSEVKDYLYSIVNKFLSDSFLGNIVKNFVPEESLKNMVSKSLQDQLRDKKTVEEIKELLPNIYEKIYSINISTISNFVKENEKEVTMFASALIASLLGKFLKNNKNKTLIDLLKDFDIDLSIKLKGFLITQFNIISEDKDIFDKKLIPVINSLLELKVSSIVKFFLSYLDRIINVTMNSIVRVVELYGESVLEAFDVKQMVETQIEKLDLLQVEDIILSVMNNQLKAITWFGLLLGAILGLLMPFLNNVLS